MANVRAIGIGVPGPVDPEQGVIFSAPNLGPTWNHLPVASYLSEKLGCPVCLENDVNVGAIGEHSLGAGKGFTDVVAIFVGTGIGGGLILNGELYQGTRFTAGEIGHTIQPASTLMLVFRRRGMAQKTEYQIRRNRQERRQNRSKKMCLTAVRN